MPRRAQNPHHVLTRLRRQLSEPGHVFSREELAEKTKIPLGSLKAIESGKYGLTRQIAAKISLGVPVNPFDLLRASDPLRDFTGRPLSAQSVMLEELVAPFLPQTGFETDQYIQRIAFAVAEQKHVAMQLRFLVRESFVEALESLGLTELVAEKLTEHLGEFDPAQVIYQLRPQKGSAATQWEAFERKTRLEVDKAWQKNQAKDPSLRLSPELSKEEQVRISLEAAKFERDLWTQSLQKVAKTAAQNRA
jgi:hypothetical protein